MFVALLLGEHNWDVEVIGVFTTRDEAQDAVEAALDLDPDEIVDNDWHWNGDDYIDMNNGEYYGGTIQEVGDGN
jgi:hypothetical protein